MEQRMNLPNEFSPLSKMPLSEQHFRLFCLTLEKAYGVHIGRSGRLLLNFEISSADESRHLPKVRPINGKVFTVDESFLKTSPYYLYYDPGGSQDLPLLGSFDADSHRFEAASRDLLKKQDNIHGGISMPIARLGALRGLHLVKEVICLQMCEIDFDALFDLDAALAQELRQTLQQKYNQFFDFTAIADKAGDYQDAAKRFLDEQ
jgi:hypothetical protein